MQRRSLLFVTVSAILQACGVRPATAPVTPSPIVTPAPVLSMRLLTAAPYTTHQCIEIAIDVVPAPADAFDVAGNDMWLVAIHATQQLRVPVFWDTADTPIGAWRARIQLAHPGEWQVYVQHGARMSEVQQLMVVPHPHAHGIIRVDARGFAFADDTPFLPIGLNLGWSTSQGEAVLADYERWFARLAAHGGNAARIWMASWSFGIEWSDTPLGDYTARMPQAALLDEVMRIAEQYGIFVMLCLINHGAFSMTTNAEWEANPYNQRNGGPLASPADFVTDTRARELFARRVRYIGARYAAFPALWCWEWWNEVNWTPIQETALAPWLSEMRAVLAHVDPYQHLVTSSWASVGATQLWSDTTLDFVQHHTYENDDLVRTLNAARIPVKVVLKTKPLLVSEVGLNAAGATVATAVEHVHLVNAVWAPIMLGMAGSGMYWWWDTWIDPTNQWGVFAEVSTFVRGIDMRQLRPFTALMPGMVVLGLKNDTTVLLWIRHARYTARDAMQAYQQLAPADPDWQYQQQVTTWQSVELRNLTDGSYAVTYYGLPAEHAATHDICDVRNAQGTLAVPPFVNALAVQLHRKG